MNAIKRAQGKPLLHPARLGFTLLTEGRLSFIETVNDESAIGDTASLYDEDRARLGYVANYTRAFSHRPDVMRGWHQLNGAVRSNMDLRIYELATLAAATQLRSSYCSLAHGKIPLPSSTAPLRLRRSPVTTRALVSQRVRWL
jgi:alkylhydroperoxidase family enzyme